MTRVLVCGGRDYRDRSRVFQVLDDMGERITCVITGGAPGADYLGHIWACRMGKAPEQYMAEWDRFGRRAGPIRNQRMIDEGRPGLIVAFPGGRGTADMIRRAKAAGIQVIKVPA